MNVIISDVMCSGFLASLFSGDSEPSFLRSFEETARLYLSTSTSDSASVTINLIPHFLLIAGNRLNVVSSNYTSCFCFSSSLVFDCQAGAF